MKKRSFIGLSLGSVLLVASLPGQADVLMNPLTVYGQVPTGIPTGTYYFKPEKNIGTQWAYFPCGQTQRVFLDTPLLGQFPTQTRIPKSGWFNYGNKQYPSDQGCIEGNYTYNGGNNDMLIGAVYRVQNNTLNKIADCILPLNAVHSSPGNSSFEPGKPYVIHMTMNLNNGNPGGSCTATLKPGG